MAAWTLNSCPPSNSIELAWASIFEPAEATIAMSPPLISMVPSAVIVMLAFPSPVWIVTELRALITKS